MASNPNPVDIHVGGRIRLRRTLLGMSQEKLGKAIGLTFQQVQKYERGTNRVGSSRLFQLAKVLNVPVSFFFDDMPNEVSGGNSALAEPGKPFEHNPFTKRETLELVRAYHKIGDRGVRKRVFELVKAIASDSESLSADANGA